MLVPESYALTLECDNCKNKASGVNERYGLSSPFPSRSQLILHIMKLDDNEKLSFIPKNFMEFSRDMNFLMLPYLI